MSYKWVVCAKLPLSGKDQSSLNKLCRICSQDESKDRSYQWFQSNNRLLTCKCKQPAHQSCLINEIQQQRKSHPQNVLTSNRFTNFNVYMCKKCSSPILFKENFQQEWIRFSGPNKQTTFSLFCTILGIIITEILIIGFMIFLIQLWTLQPGDWWLPLAALLLGIAGAFTSYFLINSFLQTTKFYKFQSLKKQPTHLVSKKPKSESIKKSSLRQLYLQAIEETVVDSVGTEKNSTNS